MRDQIANICWIIKKGREFQKNLDICFIDYAKASDGVDQYKLWKILLEMEYQTTWPPSWEICMQVSKQQLELDMQKQTDSKFGKGVRQGCILSPCLFNLHAQYIMQNAGLDEAQLELRFLGEISITSDTQMTPTLRQKAKKN